MTSTLHHIMTVGSDSLANSRVGVDVTGHNIANAHTPGYSRQRVTMTTKEPAQYGIHVLGMGADVQSIERVHDKFLENQIRKETLNQNKSTALSDGLSRLENLFNPEMTSTIRDRMNTFFNSLRELSNFPEESSVRINVVESATAFAQTINTTHAGVASIQDDMTREIGGNLAILNQKLGEIANLNAAIKEMEHSRAAQVNDLEDKRDGLIRDVSELIDIQAYKDSNQQYVLRGPGGSLLIEGHHAASFRLDRDAEKGMHPRIIMRHHLGDAETDVTDAVEKGRIAGQLLVRDQYGAQVRDGLNTLALGFASGFNAVHRQGFGLRDFENLNGRDFFEGAEGRGEAAANIEVSQTIRAAPDSIATGMAALTPGDNVIINDLVRMFYDPVFGDGASTVQDIYDGLVGKLGADTRQANEESTASEIVLSQLKSQRESTSGVSLDEEAANLLKYQHLFTASSRVITTVDEMFRTVLDLKR